ncbi:hypothetical protein [Micromonospora sp. NBRC 101691]|uniref:hypothetical protein n=1 Tax=Micromonospora sp. NBRC 101691 TaxID=3032198 RepID=UPI0024A57804|nr:hypothetical protein [Micromonospora sp. NBRC 101691]GLY21695.1 hypothetical protein Misp04_14270 [Micromonospora sp. NBRC 101691]
MRIDLTSSDLNRLVADLRDVPENAHGNVRKAVEFTANGIKKTSREFASGIAHAPHYPRYITYDVDDHGVGVGVSAEIGPDKAFGGQANLGHFFEYGDPRTPPQAHLGPALDIWTPDLEKGLEKAAADALEGK